MKKESIPKHKISQVLKYTFLGLIFFLIFTIAFVVSYEYLKVALGSRYDVEKMPLNYETLGTGEKKIVLIHGLTGSLNYWKRDIERITKTHQLLLVDLLGFGDSPKPKSDYSLDVQINALEKIIDKEGFNKGQTIILGHSMGTIISLALLAKHPDWFKGGVLVSIPVYSDAKEFLDIMTKHSLFNRLTVGPYAKFFCMLHPLYFMTNQFKPNNLTEDVFKDAQKHNWLSYFNSLNEIIIKTDTYSFSKKIKDKKIVFIHGKQDKTAPIENAIKLANTFSNSEFVIVNDGDHQLFLKGPNLVWDNVINF